MTRLSVIIPTLNEAQYLPGLLQALREQTRPPDEIIVADAGSSDGTRAAAERCQARVVPGGMPGAGRNAGASAAQGDTFLFLDADVIPPPHFIEHALNEFQRRHFAVSTCPVEAISDDLKDKLLMDVTNIYMQLVTSVSPRAPGFCILVRRDVHLAIGGFDETLKMAEDHDYVRRAARHGKFGLLKSVTIPVSMRRLKKEGTVTLALKYVWCEMYALAGKPIRSTPFEYEFGAFQSEKSSKIRPLLDIAELRVILGKFENPILRLSSVGLEQLDRLTSLHPVNFAAEQIQLLLEQSDAEILQEYLKKRLSILMHPKRLIARTRTHLSREIIRIVDKARLYSSRESSDNNQDQPD